VIAEREGGHHDMLDPKHISDKVRPLPGAHTPLPRRPAELAAMIREELEEAAEGF
jgi:hypothetical protein